MKKFLKKHNKIITIVVLVILIATFVVVKVVKAKTKNAEPEYEIAKIEKRTLTNSISCSGNLKTEESKNVTSLLVGSKITEVNVKVGDKVNVGDILVTYSSLKSCTIEGDMIPRLIDELPVIAVLATQAEGKTIIKDAQDLRNKESDRIKAIVTELKKRGADIEEKEDGFIVRGKTKLKGEVDIEVYKDHRLAMSMYVAGLACEKPIIINEFEWVGISFPEFERLFESLISE